MNGHKLRRRTENWNSYYGSQNNRCVADSGRISAIGLPRGRRRSQVWGPFEFMGLPDFGKSEGLREAQREATHLCRFAAAVFRCPLILFSSLKRAYYFNLSRMARSHNSRQRLHISRTIAEHLVSHRPMKVQAYGQLGILTITGMQYLGSMPLMYGLGGGTL